MNIRLLVRYFIIAEDYAADAENPQLIDAYRILSSIHSVDDPPFPALVEQICCIVGLTDGRGKGTAQVVCLEEETGLPLFGSQPHEIIRAQSTGSDSWRVPNLDCKFPQPGVYTFELHWNGESLISYTLRVR